jgi:hypothetical protein
LLSTTLAFGLVGGAATAAAATRYLSPNPAPGADCNSPATACALTTSTSNPFPGDEIVLMPGDYMVGNQQLASLNSGNIHGLDGEPRPRIFSTYGFTAWAFGNVATNMTVRHLEIYTTGVGGLSVHGTGTNTVEDVVIHATGTNGNGCVPAVHGGGSVTFKNSVCRGPTAGFGVTCSCSGTATIGLRNVTAVGGTYGMAIESAQGAGMPTDYTVTATNVIARHTGGAGADVRGQGGTTGADVVINLINSNYATEEEAGFGAPPGTATVTDPGTGTNQTAAPAFVDPAGGDFHQAAGSPTIDAGVDNALNGTVDIDGQQRQIDLPGVGGANAVDIGADERGRDTTTAVTCTPGSTPPASYVNCTGTVTDGGAGPTAPTGLLAFMSNAAGFFGSPTCTLAPTMVAGQSACSVNYLPSQGGTHQITATAFRDPTHEGSQGTVALGVVPPPVTTPPGNPTSPVNPAGNVRKRKCKKKQKGAAAAKKCRKKR